MYQILNFVIHVLFDEYREKIWYESLGILEMNQFWLILFLKKMICQVFLSITIINVDQYYSFNFIYLLMYQIRMYFLYSHKSKAIGIY